MSNTTRVLHLESTDVCQAACPLCARETRADFNKSLQHHLRVEQIQHLYSEMQLTKLQKMFMCGNYGDPAAGKYTLDLYRYFRKINPNIVLGMNTNGAIQTTFWWHELAQILDQPRDYCVFSIDGLEDTNAIYRRNVDWRKLMSNATAFIAGNGNAHWDMLVYKHNQHQVSACEQLARTMGFKWFRAKVSKRPMVNGLEAPIDWQVPKNKTGIIKCQALEEKSEYVDARGRKIPCCWLGNSIVNPITNISEVKKTWKTNNPNEICASVCASDKTTAFQDQWQYEIQLS
jgi:hypothetical protein